MRTLAQVGAALTLALGVGACGGGDADKAKFESAAVGLTQQRDSTARRLDSSGAPTQVDTTRLGPAKTESILTKARKRP